MNFITRKPTLCAGIHQLTFISNDRSAHAAHTAGHSGPLSTRRKCRSGHAAADRRTAHLNRLERSRCTPSQRGCTVRCNGNGGKWLNLEGTGLHSGSFVRRSRHADRPAAHGTRVLHANPARPQNTRRSEFARLSGRSTRPARKSQTHLPASSTTHCSPSPPRQTR